MKTFSEYLEDKEIVVIDEEVVEAARILTSDVINENAMTLADQAFSYRKTAKDSWKMAKEFNKTRKAYKDMLAANAAKDAAELNLNNLMNPKPQNHVFGLGFSKFAVAASIIGLLISLGIKGYKKLAEKFHWKTPQINLFKKKLRNGELKQAVQEQRQKEEAIKRKYENELSGVYKAIADKNWDEARSEWDTIPRTIQFSEGVSQSVIKEIIKANDGDVPVYVGDRGNESYRAIKKILGIQVAKAAVRDFSSTIKGIGV